MLEIVLTEHQGNWFWKTNSNSCHNEPYPTSAEAVAAALAAEAKSQDTAASVSEQEMVHHRDRADALRCLR